MTGRLLWSGPSRLENAHSCRSRRPRGCRGLQAVGLEGYACNNRLEGCEGNDTLRGLGGADTFAFNIKLGSSKVTILDFNVADDRFLLSDGVFTKLNTRVILSGYFRANTTGLA
ncbi:hypothetical protein [Mesorhizobium sp. CN2-181]|uniref:hypothetical protein n=1 Tax=Mesorhizobium yinganensis TaxID=3157707 RepID=UPI0032B80AAB